MSPCVNRYLGWPGGQRFQVPSAYHTGTTLVPCAPLPTTTTVATFSQITTTTSLLATTTTTTATASWITTTSATLVTTMHANANANVLSASVAADSDHEILKPGEEFLLPLLGSVTLGHWTCDHEVVGSTSIRVTIE